MSRSIQSHSFVQEIRHEFCESQGLPSREVHAVAVELDGTVWAATALGLARSDGGEFAAVTALPPPVTHVVTGVGDGVWAVAGGAVHRVRKDRIVSTAPLPVGVEPRFIADWELERLVIASQRSLYRLNNGRYTEDRVFAAIAGPDVEVLAITACGIRIAVGTADGLFHFDEGSWDRVLPSDGIRRWDPVGVAAVTIDPAGRLCFGSSQGVGIQDDEGWRLITASEGLPYGSFTTAAASEDGSLWFGTKDGALRYDGRAWSVRASRRWVPDNRINAIAARANGDAWLATPHGLSRIERRPMTLAQKAAYHESAIAERHLREGRYVTEVELDRPGDPSSFRLVDTDNDGLWTGMYGAGQCFLWAATRDPEARVRARRSLDALIFLTEVTGIPGFPARAVRPADGLDPNECYSQEWNLWKKSSDPLWKEMTPRWPKSADGKWYWKTDTSSDELDGHYFLYACYFDYIADSPEEKKRVADQVRAVTDHLIRHDYCLVDWDGKPTRWARFGPHELNRDPDFINERGLNSLSIVSYLKVAEHVTGDAKYGEAARELVEDHGYLQNIFYQKITWPPNVTNDSDDEMAFMCYYNLLRYEKNPVHLEVYKDSLRRSWLFERGERNPLFNFITGALLSESLDLEESIDTLERIPLELIPWRTINSNRLDVDVERFYGNGEFQRRSFVGRGVLPVDERCFMRWNENPWRLDCTGGQGVSWNMEGKPMTLHKEGEGLAEYDGNMYLLPYYLGLAHGFIK